MVSQSGNSVTLSWPNSFLKFDHISSDARLRRGLDLFEVNVVCDAELSGGRHALELSDRALRIAGEMRAGPGYITFANEGPASLLVAKYALGDAGYDELKREASILLEISRKHPEAAEHVPTVVGLYKTALNADLSVLLLDAKAWHLPCLSEFEESGISWIAR